MADVYNDADRDEVPGTRARAVQSAANWAGGLLSLGLILGAGVWGYKLLVRDVTGVPVVRALEGPVRVAPENPGGTNAAHQGLSVNQVAAAGLAGGPAESVILAPAPLNLAAEDLPQPKLPRPVLDQAPPPASDTASETANDTADAPIDFQDVPEDALATDMAVAEALSSDDADVVLPELTGDPRADALALAEALSEGVVPLSEPSAQRDEEGLRRSPRPPSRPSDLRLAAVETPVNVATVSADMEISADSIPSGTRLVQLGAFESAEVARAQWDKIGGRFEAFFTGKQRVVQRAQSGGKTFYRLRAMGFDDLSDARRFCSALMADKADCIPVVVR